MNTKFAETTTTVAFHLALSKRQCYALLVLRRTNNDPRTATFILGGDSLKPLDAKGLVFWHHDAAGNPCGFAGLTKAGELVADLLAEAGVTEESCLTPSITKRLSTVPA